MLRGLLTAVQAFACLVLTFDTRCKYHSNENFPRPQSNDRRLKGFRMQPKIALLSPGGVLAMLSRLALFDVLGAPLRGHFESIKMDYVLNVLVIKRVRTTQLGEIQPAAN